MAKRRGRGAKPATKAQKARAANTAAAIGTGVSVGSKAGPMGMAIGGALGAAMGLSQFGGMKTNSGRKGRSGRNKAAKDAG